MVTVLLLRGLLLILLPLTTTAEKLSFKPPALTNEEKGSILTPSNLQCDACLAASFQIGKALYFDLSSRPKMPVYEVYETLEAACDEGHYQNYGIKQVDGVNRISGQGLKAASKAGMLSGGGKWPSRLVDKCSQVVGEVGEEEVFKHYQKVATLPPHLQEMEFATLLCIREEEPRDCATKEIVKQLIP